MSEELKHTPGPWTLLLDDRYRPGVEASDSAISIVIFGVKNKDDDYAGIRGKDDQEATANAHLIAAAPELLEALKTLATQAESHGAEGIYWDKARAAIAKAEGRAE
jgi:hypothetical protein